MKKTYANWRIEINLECPYKSCGSYLDLMDSSRFPSLHDDGSPLRIFEAGKNYGQSDNEIKHMESITCPDCEREIKLEGIQW